MARSWRWMSLAVRHSTHCNPMDLARLRCITCSTYGAGGHGYDAGTVVSPPGIAGARKTDFTLAGCSHLAIYFVLKPTSTLIGCLESTTELTMKDSPLDATI